LGRFREGGFSNRGTTIFGGMGGLIKKAGQPQWWCKTDGKSAQRNLPIVKKKSEEENQ